MVSESLARRFKPAGFDQPEGSRHQYTKPRPELQEAFERWAGELPKWSIHPLELKTEYGRALKSIEEIGEIKTNEANSLLAGFNPKPGAEKDVGLFVSACYAHSLENVVIFDVDAPKIDGIGYQTDKDIINNGSVGNFFAAYSSGLSINNGICEGGFAWRSSGVAVNNGECGQGFDNCRGTIMVLKEPKSYGYLCSAKIIVAPPFDFERMPELKTYLDEFSNLTKSIKDDDSAKIFLERYGPNPKEKIELEIKEILRKGRYQI